MQMYVLLTQYLQAVYMYVCVCVCVSVCVLRICTYLFILFTIVWKKYNHFGIFFLHFFGFKFSFSHKSCLEIKIFVLKFVLFYLTVRNVKKKKNTLVASFICKNYFLQENNYFSVRYVLSLHLFILPHITFFKKKFRDYLFNFYHTSICNFNFFFVVTYC